MPARSFITSRNQAGRPLLWALRSHLRIADDQARRLIREGKVRLGGIVCHDPTRRLRTGQRIEVRQAQSRPAQKTAGARAHGGQPADDRLKSAIEVRHVDDQVVVVDKPPGLTTSRSAEDRAEFGARAQRFLPPTLVELLPDQLAQRSGGRVGRLRPVHRLDRDTSGLLVFARTPLAESHLGKQFRAHTVERRYLALVRGRAKTETIESYLVRDRGDGRRGSSSEPGVGQRAVTHVRLLEDLGDYSLVECRLETGRTHQVRIHLGERGTPLCGERVYDRPMHGRPLPDGSGAQRPMLHAASLGFEHPKTGTVMRFQAALPMDMKAILDRLRKQERDRL